MTVPTYQPNESLVWSGETNYDDKYQGALYITNKRLLFESKVGAIRKRDAPGAEMPLKDITSASIETGPWDWSVLVIVAHGQKHRFLVRAASPDALIKRIGELIAGQKRN